MIPCDVPCPACTRKEALVSLLISAEEPRRREYECACGCRWVEPPYLPPLPAKRTSPPWYHPCAKCGTSEGHDVKCVSHLATISGPKIEQLRLTCRFCQHEHDIPTMDANATPTPSPTDDPMQAHVTLGALRKILDDRGEDLIERAREIIAKECAALAERIRRDPR